MENPLFSRIQRQISRNQRFIFHLGSSYALIGVNMVTMFILAPLLYHHLGKELNGVWLVLFGITNYFNLSSFGFGQTFTLELIKKQNKPKEVNKLVNTLLFSLLMFACSTFPIFLAIHFNLHFFKISEGLLPIASRSLWLIYFVFFINFLGQLPYNVLFVRNKLALRNGIEIGKVILNFALTFWVIRTGGGIVKLAGVTVLGTLVYTIVLLIVSKQYLTYTLNFAYFSKKLFLKFLKPSLWYFMLGIAMQVILFSDSILVSSLKSPVLVTVYAYALRIPDVSMRFIFKIADVKIPKIPVLFEASDWLKMWLLHNRLIWLTAAISGFVCITLILFGGDIIHLWMGQDFMVNQTLIIIFSLNMFTQCVMHVPAIFIQSIGMHKRASILSMIGAPVAVVGAWYLSKQFGIEGIAFSMCAVQFLVGILVVPQFYNFLFRNLRSQGHHASILRVQ